MRELKLKERQAICRQTLPQFAQFAEPVMAKVEEAFEEAWRPAGRGGGGRRAGAPVKRNFCSSSSSSATDQTVEFFTRSIAALRRAFDVLGRCSATARPLLGQYSTSGLRDNCLTAATRPALGHSFTKSTGLRDMGPLFH